MNTCIKCGCQDAYPSLPPCPTPTACPNPQPCSEIFDAQCIVFTLPDIECGLDIVVAQDSSVAEALDSIVSFFCEEIFGLVQSVTGLNTDNTDPRNPIVRISVDGTTITGLGTPASPLVATSTPYTLPTASPTVLGGIKVGTGLSIDGSGVLSSTSSITGSGTNNYVARWTPSGTALGTSLIQDNNACVGIGVAPAPAAQDGYVKILNATNRPAILFLENTANPFNNTGIRSTLDASLAGQATGIYNTVVGSSGVNTGIFTFLTGAGTKNTGAIFSATGAALNYSLKLVDGTEGIGKVLTDVTGNGEAHWVTPATPPGAMTWSTLTGINPSALMLPNNGYIIRDTSGSGTLLTLPVYGTCSIGNKIEIIAAGATPATLSNWSIDPGQLGDTIYASFSVPSGFDILEQTFTTGGLGLPITFNGAVVGAANCRKVSMTLVCIKDNGSSYIWQLTTATNYNLVP
jgi:hypothetical protein